MNGPVNLLLGVHAHQPVGNFPEVVAEAHRLCYRPFLQTLNRFPDFRFSLHFSGWLLDELEHQYPEDMALLGDMVRRGQVELFGGGECEPVLAAIPARDRTGQLIALSAKLEQRFGQRPRGAWLTERVWEATVVPSLADSGIGYVTVDDYHFLCTGRREEELDGYYTTEEDGRTLDLFPISEALRYRLPFAPAHEAVAYLEDLAAHGRKAAIYFDDIEKFGIWPETYEWVYGRGWLEQFIVGVLGSKHIRTSSFGEFRGRHPTRGVVYLPTASYSEMNEWTLPPAAATTYSDLVHRAKDEGTLGRDRPFLRGGIWRNFFSRYPESNWMHKRMLGLSARVAATRNSRPEHVRHLYRAQANDAYWHGLFGGLYLPHLRRAVWNHLLLLEADLNRLAAPPAEEWTDADIDGRPELFMRSPDIQAVSRADGLAAIHELDGYALAHNFGDTLRRHTEHYYRKLDQAPAAATAEGGIASAHDRVEFKDVITPEDTVPDAAPRALFVDRIVDGGDTRLVDNYVAIGPRAFASEAGNLRIEKRYEIDGRSLTVRYRFAGAASGHIECQINVAMPSCDGFSGRYILADGMVPCGFGQDLTLTQVTTLTLDDRALGGGLVLRTGHPVNLVAGPHHTVSQSEAGFEKVMQAACVTLSWPLAAHGEMAVTVEIFADDA